MDTKQVIETIKKEAEKNKAMEDVCYVWAARDRARNQVTINALMQRMKAEGFDYNATDYASVLKTLANLGFGKLETDHKGHVKALKDIKVTLQSIGKAVCASQGTLDSFKSRNKYKDLPSPPKLVKPPVKKELKRMVDNLQLNMTINGKLVRMSFPNNLTSEEIALLISGLQDKGAE